ncbi:hypothetical protein CI105_07790 [Candidatus Izimaplasma bacterium ZiA1]|uniref:AI-2E family transporter n=1 Tax=Candidatus Izimoplasma sp. ZiA1 TaxID=2024899 RepID=UPI000BAA4A53|nr:hypothetical protein CI105_07790 [Candidatus Izimaplasma bacterium ZiA1]
MKNREKRISLLINLAIISLVLLSFTFASDLFGKQISNFFGAFNAIFFPLIVALFISYLMAPLVKLVEKYMKIKQKWLSVVIVFLIVIVLLGLFVYLIGDIIYVQAISFIDNDWDSIVTWFNTLINDNATISDIYASVTKYLNVDTVSPVFINLFSVVKSLTSIVVSIVLIPVFLFFILTDKEKIFEGILSLVPKKYQTHARELGHRGNVVIEKYFNGRFLSMLIMSIFFTILFFILGFKERSIFFGFMLGFLDIVPYIGPFVGVVIPLLYSFTVKDSLLFGEYSWIAVLVGNGVGQGLQSNIIQPVIMGREVKLHPLLVLSSFVFFGSLMGITGIILAIPITGMIKTSMEYYVEQKELHETIKKTEKNKSSI